MTTETGPGDRASTAERPIRASWAESDPLLLRYYDEEWGVPVTDERGLFERIALESFQSGLSWLAVLRKRPALRAAFDGFDPDRVAAYGAEEIGRLLADPGIIRNRRKIEATIGNARAVVRLRASGQDLPRLVWSHQPERTPVPRTEAEVPSVSAESRALAAELKARGFTFVGPTTMHALMCAVGVIDAHLAASHRRGCSGLWHPDGSRRAAPRLPAPNAPVG